MKHIAYEQIVGKAFELIDNWTKAPSENFTEAYSTYLLFIAACGWTDQEFDRETLKRIDNSWESSFFKVLNL
jgi:hypothetical protein